MRPRVSVVIPALNEADNLSHVLARLPEFMDEVVLVDGHSTDDTISVARALRPDIRVVTQNYRGKGNALACGFAMCSGDIIVMLDADGSTDPAEIPLFIAKLLDGADFVKGSRYMTGGGSEDLTRVRRYGNALLTGTVNVLFRARYTELCYGYMAFWRRHLPLLTVDVTGFEVETLLTIRAARAGLKVAEVPSVELNRVHGESNLRPVHDGLRVLRTIIGERLRRDRTARLAPPWEALTNNQGYSRGSRTGPVARSGGVLPSLSRAPRDRRSPAANPSPDPDAPLVGELSPTVAHDELLVIAPSVEDSVWLAERIRMPGVRVTVGRPA